MRKKEISLKIILSLTNLLTTTFCLSYPSVNPCRSDQTPNGILFARSQKDCTNCETFIKNCKKCYPETKEENDIFQENQSCVECTSVFYSPPSKEQSQADALEWIGKHSNYNTVDLEKTGPITSCRLSTFSWILIIAGILILLFLIILVVILITKKRDKNNGNQNNYNNKSSGFQFTNSGNLSNFNGGYNSDDIQSQNRQEIYQYNEYEVDNSGNFSKNGDYFDGQQFELVEERGGMEPPMEFGDGGYGVQEEVYDFNQQGNDASGYDF